MKKEAKRDGFFKFGVKHTLWSSNFSNYKLLIPNNLWNSILLPNFIFLIFWLLVWERRKKVTGF